MARIDENRSGTIDTAAIPRFSAGGRMKNDDKDATYKDEENLNIDNLFIERVPTEAAVGEQEVIEAYADGNVYEHDLRNDGIIPPVIDDNAAGIVLKQETNSDDTHNKLEVIDGNAEGMVIKQEMTSDGTDIKLEVMDRNAEGTVVKQEMNSDDTNIKIEVIDDNAAGIVVKQELNSDDTDIKIEVDDDHDQSNRHDLVAEDLVEISDDDEVEYVDTVVYPIEWLEE